MLIGVDMDEVLASLIPSFLNFYNCTNRTSFTRNQIHEYELWKTLGITRKKAVNSVLEFIDSPDFKNIQPVLGSVGAINTLTKSHDLVIITSRFEESYEETKKWVGKYFPNKFKNIYFANNTYAQKGNGKDKSEICLDLGVDILVEDSLEYTLKCAEEGIKVLLLDCPWNQSEKLPENVTRVFNWRAILDMLC